MLQSPTGAPLGSVQMLTPSCSGVRTLPHPNDISSGRNSCEKFLPVSSGRSFLLSTLKLVPSALMPPGDPLPLEKPSLLFLLPPPHLLHSVHPSFCGIWQKEVKEHGAETSPVLPTQSGFPCAVAEFATEMVTDATQCF